jgi:surface polysaccharide O-acyltransferase-like enzyme
MDPVSIAVGETAELGRPQTPASPATDRAAAVDHAPLTRPRILGGDALRSIAVLGVVVIHAGYWPAADTDAEAALWHAVVLLARFSVPAFVVLAGMMLEYNRKDTRTRVAPFLRRRGMRTVVPWVAWACVYMAFGALVTGEVPHSAAGIADWLAYGAGHLYFLLLVPQLYVLFLLWPRGLRGQLALAMALAVLQTGLCIYRLTGPVPDGLISRLVDWHGYQEAPFWLGYFAAGIVLGHLARNGVRLRPSPGLIAAGAATVAAGSFLLLREDPLTADGLRMFESGTGAFLLPLMPVLAVGVVVLVLATAGAVLEAHVILRRAVERVSRDALGIYITQAIVLYGVGRILFRWLQASPLIGAPTFVLLVILTFAGSMAITEVLARTRLRFLVGL